MITMDPILLFAVQLGTFRGDIWFALFLLFSVLIFSWAKGKLGDMRAAILFSLAMVILVFYQHPSALWAVVGVYVFWTYGKDMFKI